jgi:RHS repeat-associated protein
MLTPRKGQSATLQADGSVLFWGGSDKYGNPLTYGEVLEPGTQSVRFQSSQPPPNVLPFVEASLPQDGEQSTPLDTLIAVRFSKPLQVQSLNANTAILSSPDNAVVAKVVPAEGGMLAFVTPQNSLLLGTRYTLSLDGPTDKEGASLPSTTISFTTAGTDNSGNGGNSGQPGILTSGSASSGNPLDSPWRNLPPLQAPSGVTALAGQALKLDGTPLEGVTLRIDTQTAKTDGTGRFLLKNIGSGHHAMIIDGRTANRDSVTYGVYEDGVDVTAGQTTALTYTIWMTQIDTAHAVKIAFPTASEVAVTNVLLPGLEFHIPANTTITDSDGNVASNISITPIPIKQPPFPLPKGVNVPIYFTIQPGGGYITVAGSDGTKGGRLIYPNSYKEQAETRYNFWDYDADNKGWYVYGHGSVSQDRKSIVPDPGVEIYELTGAMVATGMGAAKGPCPGCPKDGDPVDLGTGLFVYEKTDMFLPDTIPLILRRTYRQDDSVSRAFGNGTTHNYDIFLMGDSNPYTYMELVQPDGGRVRFDRSSTGTEWTQAVYQNISSPGYYFGAKINWHGPAFGGGWTLTTKDGTVMQFPESSFATVGQQAALLSITDRYGNAVTLTRDANSNLTSIVAPNGRTITLTYDSSNRITQAHDNIGRTVQYVYGINGYLSQVTDVNGGVWKYAYDASNRMSGITDARNIQYLQIQYDGSDRVQLQTQADGGTFQYAYTTDSNGNITETDVTDPNGNVRKVTFNPPPTSPSGFISGGLAGSYSYMFGPASSLNFSSQWQRGTNLISGVTDALGRTTNYTFDGLGNLLSMTFLAGTPNAVTTSFTYDTTYSALTSITDPLGHVRQIGYDSKGNPTSATDAIGNTATFTYTSAGQVLSATDPNGNTTQFAYSGGDLVSITDPLARSINRSVDGAGRLLSTTDSLGQITRREYNPFGEVTKITDAQGGATALSYDPNGNLASLTDARNTSTPTVYTYDNMDRLQTRTDPLGNSESYQHDGNGNLTQFTDRRGKIAKFSYDALNRRTFVGYGWTGGTNYESTMNYTYDNGSRPTQAVDSQTGTITWGFDGLDRLTSEMTPNGSVGYSYDAAGRRQTTTVAGQPTVNYSFDAANRVIQIMQGSSTVQFSYDSANRRTTLTLPNGVVTAYSYDSASELTSVTYSSGSTVLGNLAYGYDLDGRRSSITGSFARTGIPYALSSATYDANNRLTSWGGTPLSYDLNGNMTSDVAHGYTWDARNHLTQIDSGATAIFSYDALGRRVNKNILGASTSFLYDGANPVQELSGNTPTANLVTGSLDEYFTRTDAAGPRHFLTDALGSTLALSDTMGTVQTSYTLEPFGNTTVTGSPNTNSFEYTGRELDVGNLYFYRARYYNPTLGRFISEDPIGFRGGINFYAYVGNNPISRRDPFGLDWLNNLADFSAGAGSVLTFGLTDLVNDATGASSVVNNCSGWHKAGEWTGIGLSTAIGGAEGLEEGLDREAGEEWSHWIPDRAKQGRGGLIPDFIVDSDLNGQYVSDLEHALNDDSRMLKGMTQADKNPAWLQQLNRIPPWVTGAGAGAAYGGASAALAGRNCGCK